MQLSESGNQRVKLKDASWMRRIVRPINKVPGVRRVACAASAHDHMYCCRSTFNVELHFQVRRITSSPLMLLLDSFSQVCICRKCTCLPSKIINKWLLQYIVTSCIL